MLYQNETNYLTIKTIEIMLVLSNKKDVKRESNLRSAIYFIIALATLLTPLFIWGNMA